MWIKLLPYAGWPLAALLFFLWLDGRENLAAEVERCNTEKVAHAADAANAARAAVEEAYAARMADLRRQRIEADAAIADAVAGRDAALTRAGEAQRVIDELMRDIENGNDAPIGTVCLGADVPGAILDGMR